MKLSWLFVILLLIFVAIFSVQNAHVITVHFLAWDIQISAALVIQLAGLLGALVGLGFGAFSRRPTQIDEKPVTPAPPPPTPATPHPALPAPDVPVSSSTSKAGSDI